RFYSEERMPSVEGSLDVHSGSAGLYEQADVDPVVPASAEGDERWYAPSEKSVIRVNRSTLADPTALVATLAHELGHVLLLGHGPISEGTEDDEPLTDLLTIFLGLGVFTGNSRIRSRNWRDGTHEGWHIQRLGYLDQRQVGYGLALFAAIRDEDSPS